jgi:hypothetical protein
MITYFHLLVLLFPIILLLQYLYVMLHVAVSRIFDDSFILHSVSIGDDR